MIYQEVKTYNPPGVIVEVYAPSGKGRTKAAALADYLNRNFPEKLGLIAWNMPGMYPINADGEADSSASIKELEKLLNEVEK